MEEWITIPGTEYKVCGDRVRHNKRSKDLKVGKYASSGKFVKFIIDGITTRITLNDIHKAIEKNVDIRKIRNRQKEDMRNWIPIKGFSKYFINDKKQVLSKRINALERILANREGNVVRLFSDEGQVHYFNNNRIYFAAKKGIDVRDIPSDLCVVNNKLVSLSDNLKNRYLKNTKSPKDTKKYYDAIYFMKIVIKALETDDNKELTQTLYDCKDSIKRYLYATVKLRKSYIIEEIADTAIFNTLEGILNKNWVVGDPTAYICKVAKRIAVDLYKEKIKYKDMNSELSADF